MKNLPSVKSRLHKGFTVIEILITIAVLGVFFGAVTQIIQTILTTLGESRVRATALEIAQHRIELIQNIPYNDIGTVGGIPSGIVEPIELITRNGLSFTVTNSIQYIDDPFDGESPVDVINTDYKRIRVEVSWDSIYPSQNPVALVTQIAPKTTEVDLPGGTLSIRVFNAQGLPVSNAVITINNTSVTPEIHTNTLTDSEGKVILPGAPPCTSCYEISATKTGYSTDRTYGTNEVANPVIPHATVIEDETSEVSLAIDTVSKIIVTSYNQASNPVANVIFTLRGSKIIGYDTFDLPVYKYENTTNTGGYTIQVSALEWDTYTLSFESSAHTFAGSNPLLPVSLPPGGTRDIKIMVVPKQNQSLVVAVKDGFGNPLASASAQLTNGLGYDQTQTTAQPGLINFGQVFFPNLAIENYNLKVTLDGYDEATTSVLIDDNYVHTVSMSSL